MNRVRAIEVLQTLRPHFEARGIAHAGIFGSVARNGADKQSDVDIVITPVANPRLDLIDLGAVQSLLEDGFCGIGVDIVVEPIRRLDLKGAVARDRRSRRRTGINPVLKILRRYIS